MFDHSGIYKIQSNKKPDRVYIGSAKNIQKRWWVHLCDLRKNKHHSPKLQKHYNKYGEADLMFSVLLGCDISELTEKEQFFLDIYKPYFNCCENARNCQGYHPTEETRAKLREARKGKRPFLGHRHTEETKERMSAAKRGKKKSPETRERMSRAFMGNKNWLGRKHTEETRRRMSEAQKGKRKIKIIIKQES